MKLLALRRDDVCKQKRLEALPYEYADGVRPTVCPSAAPPVIDRGNVRAHLVFKMAPIPSTRSGVGCMGVLGHPNRRSTASQSRKGCQFYGTIERLDWDSAES